MRTSADQRFRPCSPRRSWTRSRQLAVCTRIRTRSSRISIIAKIRTDGPVSSFIGAGCVIAGALVPRVDAADTFHTALPARTLH